MATHDAATPDLGSPVTPAPPDAATPDLGSPVTPAPPDAATPDPGSPVTPAPPDTATPARRVRALRGATTLDVDERGHLIERTQELIGALLERNDLTEDDLISIVFTATADIHSAYPAEAAREAGITHVPLLCARELEIDGGIARCVRLLAHAYTPRAPRDLRHPYLHAARQLRTDLPE